MWKYLLSMLLAASACLIAPAQAQTQPTWTFSYTGFQDADTMQFNPNYRIDGFFSGSDTNGDGWLERGELTRFYWNSYSYFENPYTGCNGAWCRLDDFYYNLHTGQLSFDAQSHYSDIATLSSTRTVSGLSIISHGETGYWPPFYISDSMWQWTGQTQFAISPPPVDEPPMLALLPAGLLAAALLRRAARRRRSGRNS